MQAVPLHVPRAPDCVVNLLQVNMLTQPTDKPSQAVLPTLNPGVRTPPKPFYACSSKAHRHNCGKLLSPHVYRQVPRNTPCRITPDRMHT
jgi:hypothetical protein